MILLGSIQRFELERLLILHLSERTFFNDRKTSTSTLSPPPSPSNSKKTSPIRRTSSPKLLQQIPRFVVTKVDESEMESEETIDVTEEEEKPQQKPEPMPKMKRKTAHNSLVSL